MTTVAAPPRDVQMFAIAADTVIYRSRSWNRLRFEIEYGLERGTTANSYLIRGQKTALIDPPGESFTEKFLATLEADGQLASLDYIILGHINPNRVVTLKQLLERLPAVKLVGSNPVAKALEDLCPEALPRLQPGPDRIGLFLGIAGRQRPGLDTGLLQPAHLIPHQGDQR